MTFINKSNPQADVIMREYVSRAQLRNQRMHRLPLNQLGT